MDLNELGKTPISSEQPTGEDVRYDQSFEDLQDEIDKIAKPSATDRTDWKKVNSLAADILATKSKDILVTSYFAVAQIHNDKIDGFSLGMQVYRDLLENHWEGLFPVLKRMKGRQAAVDWWIENCGTALVALQVKPLPFEKINEYQDEIEKLDKILQDCLDSPPMLQSFTRFVNNIPVIEENKQEEAPPQEKVTPSEPKKTTVSAPKVSPAVTGEISSQTDSEKVMQAALLTIRSAADYFLGNDLVDPRGYRWRRLASWSKIQGLPPETGGLTEIPAPMHHETVLEELADLKSQGNYEALVRMAEEKFQNAIFWFDLQYYAAEGLSGMGNQYQPAVDALCQETAYLLCRLPGLDVLSYADGTPFSDTQTRQWLEGVRFGAEGGVAESFAASAGGGEEDKITEALQEAQGMVKKKKIRDAISLMHAGVRGSYSRKDQLLWRLGLAQLLMNAKKRPLAIPQAECVLQDIEIFQLEKWDPVLALKGLKIAYQVLNIKNDKILKTKADDVLKRIAKIDAAEALQFAK